MRGAPEPLTLAISANYESKALPPSLLPSIPVASGARRIPSVGLALAMPVEIAQTFCCQSVGCLSWPASGSAPSSTKAQRLSDQIVRLAVRILEKTEAGRGLPSNL